MHRSQHKRASKRLLVAALGVATVSYMSCAADTDVSGEEFGADSLGDDADPAAPSPDPTGASTDKARVNTEVGQAATTVIGVSYPPFCPPSGNLVPPPPPSGNLMAPPELDHAVINAAAVNAATSAALKKRICIPSGNLMGPPSNEFELAAEVTSAAEAASK